MKGCRLVRHDGSTARANPTVNLALPAPHAPTPSTPNMLHVALSACHRPTPVDSQPLALRPQLTAYACSSYRQARITAVRRPPAAAAPVREFERVRLLRAQRAALQEDINSRGWLFSNPW